MVNGKMIDNRKQFLTKVLLHEQHQTMSLNKKYTIMRNMHVKRFQLRTMFQILILAIFTFKLFELKSSETKETPEKNPIKHL